MATSTKHANCRATYRSRVIALDDINVPALYQRACAYSRLGAEEQAIEDLQRAIDISNSLRDLITEEADFEGLHGNKKFDELVSSSAPPFDN